MVLIYYHTCPPEACPNIMNMLILEAFCGEFQICSLTCHEIAPPFLNFDTSSISMTDHEPATPLSDDLFMLWHLHEMTDPCGQNKPDSHGQLQAQDGSPVTRL